MIENKHSPFLAFEYPFRMTVLIVISVMLLCNFSQFNLISRITFA